MQYLVIWAMDIDAVSPVEAAKAARRYRERDGTSANVYEIYTKDRDPVTTIDLSERGKGRDTGTSPDLLALKEKQKLLESHADLIQRLQTLMSVIPENSDRWDDTEQSRLIQEAIVQATSAIETAKTFYQ